jgi:catalase
MLTPEDSIAIINKRFGTHPKRRALHAKGTFLSGTFTATPAAKSLSRAAHLQGDTHPVLARVSNGGGDPNVPDYAPDVRGFAVGIELPDGSHTDIVSQTAPHFSVPTPEDFMDFVKLKAPGPATAVQFPVLLAKHPGAIPTLPANLKALRPAASYATLNYYAIHAFKWIDADGGERFVRYTLLPEAGDQRISQREAKRRGRDYLQEEIATRLAAGPARFTLQVQIAEPGDDVNDPSNAWPKSRERVEVGTITLTAVAEDPEHSGGLAVFDPVRVTGGIELSDDPVLHFRAKSYSVSIERRVN